VKETQFGSSAYPMAQAGSSLWNKFGPPSWEENGRENPHNHNPPPKLTSQPVKTSS